eukprot:scaffold2005_cov203-Skeletonema_marinoi.AAC.1
MAGVIWGNLTNRVRRAPPSPPIPLHSTDWGPEGRLPKVYETIPTPVTAMTSARVVLEAVPNWASSGHLRRCSDGDWTQMSLSRDKDASILSWPNIMGH